MMKRINISLCVCVASVVLCVAPSGAWAWYSSPKINSPIAPDVNNQIDHDAIADGSGGAFVTWMQRVDANDREFDIYAQRIDAHGETVWPAPVEVCTAPGYQGLPKMATDGVGGIIIAWHDSRRGWSESYSNFDVYVQRISRDGEILWEKDGILVCDAPEWQVYVEIASDGAGGAFLAWDDGRSGNSQVYVHRVGADGTPLWPANGIIAADVPFGQTDPDISSDGFGGVFVVWVDVRQLGNVDVYAQRFDPDGNRLWGAEGLGLAAIDGEQFGGCVTEDGTGGAIVTWSDGRDGDDKFDIYAQKIDPNGAILWPPSGLPICREPNSQIIPALVGDGLGGAIIAWEDGRKENGDTDIYAQRITADGVQAWANGGIPVANTDETQIHVKLLPDGAGGAFATWMDFYRGGTWWNIYAQHIDESGQMKWQENGIPVSTADGTQSDPVIVPDGSGGVIIFWYDGRYASHFNIYAQQVDARGLLGGGEFKFYTADTWGEPSMVFLPEDLILFNVVWVMPAPSEPNTYTATSAMSINNGMDFRQQTIEYEVIDAGEDTDD